MKKNGVTLIEMLIVLAILSTVLGIVGKFFSQQSILASRTQARNEVQDKTRMVMQLVSQDLQLSGQRTYYNTNGSNDTYQLDTPLSFTQNYTTTVSSTKWARADLETEYLTSTRSSSTACRNVTYYFDLTTLYRTDLADTQSGLVCGSSSASTGRGYSGSDDEGDGEGGGHSDEGDNHNGQGTGIPLANGILALDVMFRCTDGNLIYSTSNQNATCASGYSIRSAKVLVSAQSDRMAYGYQGPAYAAYLDTSSNNLGNPVTHACPANHYCYSLLQEISLPNVGISTVPYVGNNGANGGWGGGEGGGND